MARSKRFSVVIPVAALALIGLIVLELYWINAAMDSRKQEFEVSAQRALAETADLIEMDEVRDGILADQIVGEIMRKDSDAADRMPGTTLERINIRDSIIYRDGKETVIRIVEGTTSDMALGMFTEARVIRETNDSVKLKAPIEGEIPKDTMEHHGSEPQILINRIKLVNDLLIRLFSPETYQPIAQRLDRVYLDSVLHARMEANGISSDFCYRVRASDHSIIYGKGDFDDNHIYSISLFAGDLQPHPESQGTLELVFNHERFHLLGGMWAELTVSIILIMTVIGIFWYTISTVYRQKRLSLIKSDFINNMTHELKTPISTISLACEVLADDQMSAVDTSRKRYVGMIKDENKRLSVLVEKVLQTAVLEKGEVVLKTEEIDLHKMIQQVSAAFELQCQKLNGRMSLQLNASQSMILADRIHFANVIQNLLDNAFKYTGNQPPNITIATENKSEMIELSVSDNGIGIPKEHQKKIFEKLYRVPTGNLHDVKGFGLGLSYVKTIVNMHNGDITVESEPGKGSIFLIQIPLLYGKA